VGSGIFKSADPARRARAIVEAVTHHDDPQTLARISENLGGAMSGVAARSLDGERRFAGRGW
jgi:pyridoxal 5'-phosphate synthase pdxS subunit